MMVDELEGGVLLVTQEDDIELDEGPVGQVIHDAVPDLVMEVSEQTSVLTQEDSPVLVTEAEEVINIVEDTDTPDFVTEIVWGGPKGDVGPQGPQGDPAELFEREAAQDISGHRAVSPDQDGRIVHADPSDASPLRPVWVSTHAALTGENVEVRSGGFMTESSWSWTPHAPVWVGPDGVLTQTTPSSPDVNRIVRIAVAVTSTSMYVDPQQPVVIEG